MVVDGIAKAPTAVAEVGTNSLLPLKVIGVIRVVEGEPLQHAPLRFNDRAKRVFRILDHCSIYLLIAGAYTPFTLVTLPGALGWTLFGIVWAFAVTGIALKCFFTGKWHVLSTAVHVMMGWLAAGGGPAAVGGAPLAGVRVGAGGVRVAPRYAYAFWHLFVLEGSACHFLAVYRYVLPRSA